MGIIGVLIAALNIIPNGEGGTLADNLNPFATTSSSSSNTVPDSVKSKVVVQYFSGYGWQDLDYKWVFDAYSEVIDDNIYESYHAPGFEIRLLPNTMYEVEFDVQNCAGKDNFPMYYDYSTEKWCYVNPIASVKVGSFTVRSNEDGKIKILPLFGELTFNSDPDYYEAIQKKMITEGCNICITEVKAAG